MRSWAFFDQAAAVIPFGLNGRDGEVAVFYGANDDPVKAGFDALPGLNIPLDVCLGYPVMSAKIDRYAGYGYRSLCGWIQVITRVCRKSADDGNGDRASETSIRFAGSWVSGGGTGNTMAVQ